MKFRLFEDGTETDQFMDIDVEEGPLQKLGEIASIDANVEGFVLFQDNEDGGRDMLCGVTNTTTNEVIKCFKFSNIYPTSIKSPSDIMYGECDIPFKSSIYLGPDSDKAIENFRNNFEISTNKINTSDEFKKELLGLSKMSPVEKMLEQWRREVLGIE